MPSQTLPPIQAEASFGVSDPKGMNTQQQTQSTKPHSNLKPTHEEIAICAYYIWEKEGCADGHDVEHWLQAELQLAAMHTMESAHG